MPKILEANGESFSADSIVQDCNPVPSELKSTSWFAVVGESPGKEEVKLSRPFVGRSGMRITADLASLGLPRHQYDLVNVLGCRPPGDKLAELLKRCKKNGWPSPVECCRPRMNAELARHDKIVAAGGLASRALLKIPRGILTVRGGPVTLERGFMDAAGSVEVTEVYDPETGELVETADVSAMAERFSAVGGAVKILPTVHPAFVLRANRWGPVFLNDLGRAVRFFLDKLHWVDPPIYIQPTAEALYRWLNSATRPWWSWDTETEYGDPLCVDLRSFQIATSAEAVVVPFYSIEEGDFGRRFYTVDAEREVRDVLRWFLTSEKHVKFGWNSGSFDRQVAEHHFGVTPKPSIDGILIHRLVNPEIPHSLGVVGSIYTDVTAWKNDADGNAISSNARTNDQLWKYGGTDGVVTDQIAPQIIAVAATRANEVAVAFGYPKEAQRGLETQCPGVPGWTLSQVDHFRQSMCVGLHKVGMYVDQAERERLISKYEAEVAVLETEIRELAKGLGAKHFDPSIVDGASFGTLPGISALDGSWQAEDSDEAEAMHAALEDDDLNPGSADQLRDFLYDSLGLVPVDYTESGLPSTSSECILGHIVDPTLPMSLVIFLEKVRKFRRIKNKYLGTYLKPFGIMDVDGSGKREVKGRTKKGKETVKRVTAHCWQDGRARANANAHVANVGRLSLSKPGMQQIPQKMRSIFIPAPGHVYVEADYDQLHLRIIAARWQIKRLLDCFLRTGDDAHLLLGVDLFGDKLTTAEGWVDVRTKPKANTTAGRIRDNNKTLRYAGAYWAMVATIHGTLLKAEDRNGDLVNCGSKVPPERRLTERDVAAMYLKWMEAEPEWQQAWRTELAYYLKYGFVADPILGRRNDFADIVRAEFRADQDVERSAIVNYPILSGEVGVAVLGEIDILESLPYSDACDRSGWGSKAFGPGTGLVMQSHDAELLEVPADKAEWACDLLRRSMNRSVPSFEVPFTSRPDVKSRWKDA